MILIYLAAYSSIASLLQSSVSHDPSEIMMICCSRNSSDYYQCWKQTVVPLHIFVETFFSVILWIESSKEQLLKFILIY